MASAQPEQSNGLSRHIEIELAERQAGCVSAKPSPCVSGRDGEERNRTGALGGGGR